MLSWRNRPAWRTSVLQPRTASMETKPDMAGNDDKTPTPTKLIVLMAFERGEDGELIPAFEPREMRDEGTAIRTARDLANRHAGVIAWSRSADLIMGEFGAPVVLFQHGEVPDLE